VTEDFTDDPVPGGSTDTPPPENKEPIDPALVAKAVDMLRAVARGNGIMSGQITAKGVEGEVHNYEGLAYYKIEPKTAEKRVPGKMNGQVLGSHSEMRAKIQAAVEKATANPDVRKHTVAVLKKRRDLGVAVENFYITLDRLRQNFVVHEGCTQCGKDGRTPCGFCHAKGKVTCRKCHGTKEMMCPVCRGTQFINGPNGRQSCTRCHGRGRARCTECQALGFETCQACRGTGQLQCQNCNGTGWHSLVGTLEVRAKSHYDYDKSDMPPELPALIDALGPKLVTEQHAQAKIIEDEERYRELAQVSKPDEYVIPYHLRVPYGKVTFSLRGKEEIGGMLFGFTPRLIDLPPFLEKPLAPSFAALDAAAAGGGNGKLRAATRSRMVGETVLTTLRFPRKKALRMLQKRYPVGVDGARLQKTILAADKALAHVMRGPRTMGLAIGALGAGTLYAAYMFAGRGPLAAVLSAQDPRVLMIADLAVALAGCGCAAVAAQVMMTRSVRQALGKLAAKVPGSQLVPKAHLTMLMALGLAVPLFFSAMEGAHLAGRDLPSWYAQARGQIVKTAPVTPEAPPLADNNAQPAQ
jgi:hypothetical protein